MMSHILKIYLCLFLGCYQKVQMLMQGTNLAGQHSWWPPLAETTGERSPSPQGSLSQISADHIPKPSPALACPPALFFRGREMDWSTPDAMEGIGDVEREDVAVDPSSIIQWLCDLR